jgi:hypothetical protein
MNAEPMIAEIERTMKYRLSNPLALLSLELIVLCCPSLLNSLIGFIGIQCILIGYPLIFFEDTVEKLPSHHLHPNPFGLYGEHSIGQHQS